MAFFGCDSYLIAHLSFGTLFALIMPIVLIRRKMNKHKLIKVIFPKGQQRGENTIFIAKKMTKHLKFRQRQ